MFRRLGIPDDFVVEILEIFDCRPCIDVVFWAARGLLLPPS